MGLHGLLRGDGSNGLMLNSRSTNSYAFLCLRFVYSCAPFFLPVFTSSSGPLKSSPHILSVVRLKSLSDM
jgi:hypothetical protein